MPTTPATTTGDSLPPPRARPRGSSACLSRHTPRCGLEAQRYSTNMAIPSSPFAPKRRRLADAAAARSTTAKTHKAAYANLGSTTRTCRIGLWKNHLHRFIGRIGLRNEVTVQHTYGCTNSWSSSSTSKAGSASSINGSYVTSWRFMTRSIPEKSIILCTSLAGFTPRAPSAARVPVSLTMPAFSHD